MGSIAPAYAYFHIAPKKSTKVVLQFHWLTHNTSARKEDSNHKLASSNANHLLYFFVPQNTIYFLESLISLVTE
jgi:hypothetical protein